jgi:hypothetical protein
VESANPGEKVNEIDLASRDEVFLLYIGLLYNSWLTKLERLYVQAPTSAQEEKRMMSTLASGCCLFTSTSKHISSYRKETKDHLIGGD